MSTPKSKTETSINIVIMHGDQTGEELLKRSLHLCEPDVLDSDLKLRHFDLSLENRRATKNQIVHQAATDLGGHPGTVAFTDEVIQRVRNKLEVWSSLS